MGTVTSINSFHGSHQVGPNERVLRGVQGGRRGRSLGEVDREDWGVGRERQAAGGGVPGRTACHSLHAHFAGRWGAHTIPSQEIPGYRASPWHFWLTLSPAESIFRLCLPPCVNILKMLTSSKMLRTPTLVP